MTATERGMAAQMFFVTLALEYGWEPAEPVSPDAPYDVLINDKPNIPGWARVQVKRVYCKADQTKKEYPTVSLKRNSDKRYKRSDAEYLAAVDMDTQVVYLIPWEDVYRLTRLRITDKHKRFAYRF